MRTSYLVLIVLLLFTLSSCKDNASGPENNEDEKEQVEENGDGEEENDDEDDEEEIYCCVVSFGGEPGDGSTTRGVEIHSTHNGGYVIAGHSSDSSGDFEEVSEVGRDIIFLQKLNSDLEREWIQAIGGSYGPNTNSVFDLEPTNDSGYVLSGSFSSNDGDFAGEAKGVRSIFVWKTDSRGETEWLSTFGGTDWEDAEQVKQTSDGGFIITGRSASNNLDFEGLRSRGTNYMFLLKLNSEGKKEWLKSYSNSPQFNDYAYAVTEADKGGFYMGGSLQPATPVLIKTDDMGNTEWVKMYDHIDSGSIREVSLLANGDLLLAGNNVLMRTDEKGEMIWESDLKLRIPGITLLESNTFVTATDARGDLEPFTDLEHQYVWDMGLIKFDLNGNLIWKSAIGGSGTEKGYSITPSPDGGYVAIGGSSSNDGILSGLLKGSHEYLFVIKTNEQGNPITLDE